MAGTLLYRQLCIKTDTNADSVLFTVSNVAVTDQGPLVVKGQAAVHITVLFLATMPHDIQ